MDSSLLETYVFDENNYKSLINTSLTYHIIPFLKKNIIILKIWQKIDI
jgi:hypothetical protein